MEANDRIPLKYELARMNGRIYRIPVLPESIQILLDKHIVLVDGEYRISIPKSEVIGIGITGKEYEQICSEIGAANKLLKETIDEVLATPGTHRLGFVIGDGVVSIDGALTSCSQERGQVDREVHKLSSRLRRNLDKHGIRREQFHLQVACHLQILME